MDLRFVKLGAAVLALIMAASACGGSGGSAVPHSRTASTFVDQPDTGGDGGGIASCATTGTCNPNCPGQVDSCTKTPVTFFVSCDGACSNESVSLGPSGPSIAPDPNNPNCFIVRGQERCSRANIYFNGPPGTVSGLAPGLAAIVSALTRSNLATKVSSAAEAQAAVNTVYQPAQQAFSTTAETLEIGSWTQDFTTAFNGTTPPTFTDPTTITGDTLISFSANNTTERNFVTTVDQVVRGDGTVATPAEIQSILDLPAAPQYSQIDLSFPEGAQVFAGEVAGGEAGFGGVGGAAELFSASAATAGESVAIADALEALAVLLLLNNKRLPMSHAVQPSRSARSSIHASAIRRPIRTNRLP